MGKVRIIIICVVKKNDRKKVICSYIPWDIQLAVQCKKITHIVRSRYCKLYTFYKNRGVAMDFLLACGNGCFIAA